MGISEFIMSIDPTIRAIIGINVCICLGIYWAFVNKKKKEKEHIYKNKETNKNRRR